MQNKTGGRYYPFIINNEHVGMVYAILILKNPR